MRSTYNNCESLIKAQITMANKIMYWIRAAYLNKKA